jgi:5-methyltetrahydrofolate--homocysteine methyltransferase
MEEHRLNAYFRGTKWVRENLPHAHISGGVSNVSFSFRGNDTVSEASGFLVSCNSKRNDDGNRKSRNASIYDETKIY